MAAAPESPERWDFGRSSPTRWRRKAGPACGLSLIHIFAGESIFCSDPKAELFHYTSEFLKKLGYEVLVLDFKNPAKSMRYNLLQPVIDAINEGDTCLLYTSRCV